MVTAARKSEDPDICVELQVACPVASVPSEAALRSWLKQALRAAKRQASGRFDVTVRVVGEGEMRDLNLRFRSQDKTTNVLAFPAGELNALPDQNTRPLGDLVVCGPVVEREARDQGKLPSSHWAHMVVHGMLHLLGYDHDTEAQAAAMESMETRILADHGIEDPYRAR